jgi:hypothetical protein
MNYAWYINKFTESQIFRYMIHVYGLFSVILHIFFTVHRSWFPFCCNLHWIVIQNSTSTYYPLANKVAKGYSNATVLPKWEQGQRKAWRIPSTKNLTVTLAFDLWPSKSIGFQILLRTKYISSLVTIHWRMLILRVFIRMLRKDRR